MKKTKLDQRSINLRKIVVSCLSKKGRGHVGPAMSMIEILRVIYDNFLKVTKKKEIVLFLVKVMVVLRYMQYFTKKAF